MARLSGGDAVAGKQCRCWSKTAPKRECGIALYLDTPQKPAKPGPLAVVAGMTRNHVFKALIVSCLAHFTGNQRGMLDAGDPEYLHQMRVALRRLRSVFSTFAPLIPPAVTAPPVAETRWLARILGTGARLGRFRRRDAAARDGALCATCRPQ